LCLGNLIEFFTQKLFYRSAKFFARKNLNCFIIIQKQKAFILE